MSAYRGQLRMELTLSEYRLFQVFMHHIGQILSREQLMERLWSVDETFVDDNTLSVCVWRLRQKLECRKRDILHYDNTRCGVSDGVTEGVKNRRTGS